MNLFGGRPIAEIEREMEEARLAERECYRLLDALRAPADLVNAWDDYAIVNGWPEAYQELMRRLLHG